MSLGAYNGKSKSLVSPFESTSSYSFDGSDDFVETGIQPDFIHTNATMSYWVKMKDFTDTQLSGTHHSKRFYLGFHNQTAAMGVQGAGNVGSGTDLSSLTAVNEWHHIALVADNGTATYYLDGVARDTMSYTPDAASNPNDNLYIGAYSHSSTNKNFMHAAIDEFAVFSSALTASEVDALYNNGHPGSLLQYSTLKAHYRMGEGTLTGGKRDGDDNFLFDQSTNGGLGSELTISNPYASSQWTTYGNIVSNPSTNSIRVERGASGGSNSALQATLASGGILTGNVTVGKTYRLKFDFETDETSGTIALARFYDGSSYTTLQTGSGSVNYLFTAANAGLALGAIELSPNQYVEFSNISFKEVQNSGTISGAQIQADGESELITGFTNGSVSPFDTFTSSGRNITAAIETSANAGGAASNTISILSGQSYKVTFNLTYNSGSGAIRVAFVGSATGAGSVRSNIVYINSSGLHEVILTATSSASHLQFAVPSGHTVNFSATDISVKVPSDGVPLQLKGLKPISRGDKALSFDGGDDVVDIGASSTFFSGNVNTISMWVKMPDTSTGAERIFVSNSDAGGSDLRIVVETSGKISVDFWNGSSLSSTAGGPVIDDNQWHHVAFTTTASAQALYVDGASVATTTHTRASRAGSVSATIGAHVASSVYADVDVSDVAIFNAALSAPSVKAIYNAGQPTHLTVNMGAYTYKDNLQAYYKMGSGTVPGADGSNGFLFDQTSPGVGPELMKPDDDLYIDSRWYVFSDPEKTYPSGTAARFTNPESGGWNQGGRIFLTTGSGTHALTANMETGSVYKLSFDFLTDDSDAVPSYHDGTSATSLPAGSGSKTFYFTFSGNAATRLEAANVSASKFVEFSKLSLAKVNGHTATITSATIISGDVPTPT